MDGADPVSKPGYCPGGLERQVFSALQRPWAISFGRSEPHAWGLRRGRPVWSERPMPTGTFLLADIGGYTRFLSDVGIEHAKEITSHLFNRIVEVKPGRW